VIFARKEKAQTEGGRRQLTEQPWIAIWPTELKNPQLAELLKVSLSNFTIDQPPAVQLDGDLRAVILLHPKREELHAAAQEVTRLRKLRDDGYPILIPIVSPQAFTELGRWLNEAAEADTIDGLRLIAAEEITAAAERVPALLEPITSATLIRMPVSPEVENSPIKFFYAISPELRSVVRYMAELAANNVARVYLLGAPGTGKTSLAYYYWLNRAKGRFIAVNLSSESTGDKAAMKSLLCGHVAGSIAGSGAREGALSYAEDGVCFLDESHGVTGTVMQILMEVLENNQFLPFGATKKRSLDCSIIFASNRSWETLRSMINLDEHARLGATIVKIPDLRVREEDLIAVTAACLSKFAAQCKTWKAPSGISNEGWQLLRNCRWNGNTRALMRVMETACVAHATAHDQNELIAPARLLEGIEIWEPAEHESLAIYASYGSNKGLNKGQPADFCGLDKIERRSYCLRS
jgi:transcriptional regulator with GAF, ATPase, and Fis domain